MPFDPYNIICEILGQPAQQMQNPVNLLTKIIYVPIEIAFAQSEAIELMAHFLFAPSLESFGQTPKVFRWLFVLGGYMQPIFTTMLLITAGLVSLQQTLL